MVAASTRLTLVEKNQASMHRKLNETHANMNKFEIQLCDVRKDVGYVLEGLSDIKVVIDNNTKVNAALEVAFIKMTEQRDTTKNNISALGKIIIWVGTVSGMAYAAYHWIRGINA